MTQHKQLRDNYIAVRVPDDINNPAIIDGVLGDNWADEEFEPVCKLDGSYTFLFLTSNATEEDCRKVVERDSQYPDNFFKLYGYKEYEVSTTATESFTSLLQSVGITSGVWAVLEVNKN